MSSPIRRRLRHRSFLLSLAAAAAASIAGPARAEWILYFPWSAEDIAVGDGRMVACGWNTYGVYSTTDGINWTRLGNQYQSGRSICYGNGQFWYMTSGTELWRTDGVSEPVLVNNLLSSSKLAFGKGRLIRGNDSGVSYSTNGVDWQTAAMPVAGDYEMEIKCFGEFFVATSHSSIITSPDGAIWTLRATGTSDQPKYIAFDGTTHVVISAGGTRQWRSTDGLTWTEQAAGPGFTLGDLHFANGLFYAVGTNGKISTSPDALGWTPQSSGVPVTLQSVNSIAGQVVVSGPNQLLRQSSTGSVAMPPITIRPAVEIEFHAEDSVTYRIEGSTDLNSWTAVETGILGHGAPVKRKYSSTGSPTATSAPWRSERRASLSCLPPAQKNNQGKAHPIARARLERQEEYKEKEARLGSTSVCSVYSVVSLFGCLDLCPFPVWKSEPRMNTDGHG